MNPTANLYVQVHRRTTKGQRAVVSGAPLITSDEAKLLLMCNGYTPTAYLAHMAAWQDESAEMIVKTLEQKGLIQPISMTEH